MAETTIQHVHVLIFHDPNSLESISVDVFDTFEAALSQFDLRLNELKAEHSRDPDWIKKLERNPKQERLSFQDEVGFHAFYRCIPIRNASYQEVICDYCGRRYDEAALNQQIFACTKQGCKRLFCSDCSNGMLRGSIEAQSDPELCPDCALEKAVHRVVRLLLPECYDRMPKQFYQDIIIAMQDHSGFNKRTGFTDGDIHRAFSRTVALQFGITPA